MKSPATYPVFTLDWYLAKCTDQTCDPNKLSENFRMQVLAACHKRECNIIKNKLDLEGKLPLKSECAKKFVKI